MGIQAGPDDWAPDQRKTQFIRACALDLEEEPVEGPSHEADHGGLGLVHGTTTIGTLWHGQLGVPSSNHLLETRAV